MSAQEPPDARVPALRASDQDRERVVLALRDGAAAIGAGAGCRRRFAVMGGNDQHFGSAPVRPGTPVVYVRAFSLMGGVDVKVKRSA